MKDFASMEDMCLMSAPAAKKPSRAEVTIMTLTSPARSEARKATAGPMSSGVPSRLIGIARAIPAITFSASPDPSAKLRRAGVSVGPGHTVLAVTPLAATSRARVLVNAMMPPFAPEYTASSDEPTRPASEPMLMTRPKPRSIMPGTTALMTRSAPLKLMSRILSQNSSVVFTNGMKSSQPALFTTTSTGPRSASTARTADSTEAVRVTSISTAIAVPPAAVISLADCPAAVRFRSATATLNPFAASAVAMPLPMPWALPVTMATRLLMRSPPVWWCGSAGRRVPVHRPGDEGMAGEPAAEDRLRLAGRLDDVWQVQAGLDAHLVEHAHQVLGGDVAGRAGRHRAAAELAEAGLKAGAACLERGIGVGQALPAGVVEVGGDLDPGQPLDGRGEEPRRVRRVAHAGGVAEADLGGAGLGELLGEVEDPVHRDLALVRAAARGGDHRAEGEVLGDDALAHHRDVGQGLLDGPVDVALVVRLRRAHEERHLLEQVTHCERVIETPAVRHQRHPGDVVRQVDAAEYLHAVGQLRDNIGPDEA